jgi:hypothetical protein
VHFALLFAGQLLLPAGVPAATVQKAQRIIQQLKSSLLLLLLCTLLCCLQGSCCCQRACLQLQCRKRSASFSN